MIVIGYNGFTRGADVFGRLYGATGIDRHSILGHDAAVAVLMDGHLVAAVEEERLNREKKTSAFPINALEWAMREAGIRFDEVDLVAIPWSFSDSMAAELISTVASAPLDVADKFDRLRRFGELYLDVVSRQAILADFRQSTGYELPAEKLVLVPHHLAHLMCGYFLAGGGDTAFLISDGRAERLSSIMGEVRDGRIQVFEESSITVDNSVALFFAEVTRYLGFMPNNDEYKVMGMSALAERGASNPLLERVLTLHDSGRYSLPLANDPRGSHAYAELFDEVFGATEDIRQTLPFKARVAMAAQELIETVTRHQVRYLQSRTDLRNLIFEGGLALNCVNNTIMLEESDFSSMYVSFGASDPGVAIGAAVYAGREPASGGHPAPSAAVPCHTPARRAVTPYLGPSYCGPDYLDALTEYGDRVSWEELDPEGIHARTAVLLCDKVVVGWFQDRVEYGPRALGNRSILANPGYPDIKDIINSRVKHREPFRPFAPVVLEQDAPRLFELGKSRTSPYMTFVYPVKPEYRDVIPGACHVDGTSRIQTVTDSQNPELARLLRAFTELSGIPCLLNTSFNVAGEPIVCSPADALGSFVKTEIDYLVLGHFLVSKK
jgi:carbamoyltransferase